MKKSKARVALLLLMSFSALAQRHKADTLNGRTEVIKASVVTATSLLRRHGDRILQWIIVPEHIGLRPNRKREQEKNRQIIIRLKKK